MTLKTSGLPTRRLPSAALRVVARPVPVDDHDRLVAHDPGVVAARERSDVARTGNELGAVVHPDPQPAAYVVLEVRRLAAVGARDRLHVVRPPPAGLQDEPPHLAPADLEDLGAAVRELAGLVGMLEVLVLRLMPRGHRGPPLFDDRPAPAILTY